ncbi:cytochrome P450 [Actinomadura sp. WMMA1423]|uniref:cytochrome P450 n=1 Tax=Actinomadura sp. WMMA1423 TaxID=2591108 RepID=UPI0011479E34|nr:cytochrome P450 [Actinomadura sp. WMMA1423]
MPQRRGTLPISDTGVLDCPDAYAHGVPHDSLERLRTRTPVVWLDGRTAGRPGAWAVLRHRDVRYALLHPELFSPQVDGVVHGPLSEDEPPSGNEPPSGDGQSRGEGPPERNVPSNGDGPPGQGEPPGGAALIDMDPPVEAMLARIPPREPVDFVRTVARDLPETLRNTLAGGLYALLRHPAEYVRLREEQRSELLLDSAVEEMLRWWTPVLHVRRTVQRDTVVGDVPMLAGEEAMLWLVSANHDEEVFTEPGRFVPDRFLGEVPSHLCFGVGHRACLGARLARVHLRALLAALLERPGLPQSAGEPVMLRSSSRHGFASLPVRWSR